MSTPNWELIRRSLRNNTRGYQKEVKAFFSAGDQTETQHSLRDFCLIGSNDSLPMALQKIRFFREEVQQTHLKPDVYGIPITTFQESIRFKPQIRLYFSQDIDSIVGDYAAVTGEISFRLVNEKTETITKSDLERYANRIHSLFGQNGGYLWHKGDNLFSYWNPDQGYQFKIYSSNKSAAESLISKILDIQNHTPNFNLFLKDKTNRHDQETSSNTAEHKIILGKQVRGLRHLPTANVRFKHAEIHLHGLQNPINLVDLTGFRQNPIIRG